MRRHGQITILFILCFSPYCFSQRSAFSARSQEGKMAKVNDSLYAGKYETTNAEYALFLEELKTSSPELYKECRVDSAGWSKLAPADTRTKNYHNDPQFKEYPVVNISHTAALEYCKWLTQKYQADKKRKFDKVVFTLPTREEMIAAALGEKNKMFPWGNYYLVNKKGFFMCNFKPVGDAYFVRDSAGKPTIAGYKGEAVLHAAEFPPDKDFYTMKVNSFYPNTLGIYNTSGNAAEMTITANQAMGGSWNGYGGEIWPRSIKRYFYPSPEVGFRVFMKISVSK